MTAPDAIEFIMQKSMSDCGIAALAMYLGVPYIAVSETALRVAPKVHKSGLWIRQVVQLAAAFGIMLKTAALDDEAVGILVIQLPKRSRHYVVIFQGVVINPADGLVWDLDAYLANTRGKVVCFLQ